MTFRPFSAAQMSLGSLQDEMNSLLERVWHGGVSTGPFDGQEWAPAVDLVEQSDRYLLLVEVPGVDAERIDVSHVGRVITVRGEKSRPGVVGEADRGLRTERRYGTFCRTLELPGEIDAERLSAACRQGVLQISVPKSKASMPRAVKINVSEG
ncbi:MAG: Hsp20/alpha crystallin family protein [Planctomycetes bacterium]|nr:Hsp20/alpha crystallin family protein [Planctomycetota bacterium]